MPRNTKVTTTHYLDNYSSLKYIQQKMEELSKEYDPKSIIFGCEIRYFDRWDERGSPTAYFECTRPMTPEELVQQQAVEDKTDAEILESQRQQFLVLKSRFENKEPT